MTGRCVPWIDPTCQRQEDLNWADGQAYFAGVAEAIASPVLAAYALTQPETWQEVAQGASSLRNDPVGSVIYLREQLVDPVVRGGHLAVTQPGLAVQILNSNPREVGRVLGSTLPWGGLARLGLRNLYPARSLFFAGQVDELCTISAPKLARWKWLPDKLPSQPGVKPNRFGVFNPMEARFGRMSPEHVAVRNLDGSITDRTILWNIERANGGKLPPSLDRYRRIDTFDPRTYNKLLEIWQKIFKETPGRPSTKVDFDNPPQDWASNEGFDWSQFE